MGSICEYSLQSDLTYPHTSVLEEIADEVSDWINEGEVV